MRLRTALAGTASAALLLLGTATVASSSPSTVAAWRWPVAPPVHVVRGFDAPAGPYGPGHRGVDLAALPGTPVLAAAGGTVVVAGVVAGEPVVVLAHGIARTFTELRTTYEPALPSVAVGARVRQGQRIGTVGVWPGHCPSSTVGCLHWAVRRGEIYVDPTLLMRGPVRLLPVGQPVGVDLVSGPAPMLQPPSALSVLTSGSDDGGSPSGGTPRDAGTQGRPVASGAVGLGTVGTVGTVGAVGAIGAAAMQGRPVSDRTRRRRSSP